MLHRLCVYKGLMLVDGHLVCGDDHLVLEEDFELRYALGM